MLFKDILFPIEIAKNSLGGPEFSTSVVKTQSGNELRYNKLQYPRIKYNISSGIQSKSDIDNILSFFRICQGMKYSFRFKDFMDCCVINQIIAISNGVDLSYQLIKTYYIQNEFIDRKITKPKKNTLKVYINGVVMDKDLYTLDENSGIINFHKAITKNDIISADFKFDVNMRFDVDFLSISLNTKTSYNLESINIVEVI